eukprot:TRINITY_DN59659_c0_g1_i1.p1 TRINITY_DN59659_c0_g1~~TRINITY_DN59659_c0_g1_i1.p1  ORF type:complete len:561 (+),score=54.66 TRINITY_DN59659_c0_g1_i1:117-1685(+)
MQAHPAARYYQKALSAPQAPAGRAVFQYGVAQAPHALTNAQIVTRLASGVAQAPHVLPSAQTVTQLASYPSALIQQPTQIQQPSSAQIQQSTQALASCSAYQRAGQIPGQFCNTALGDKGLVGLQNLGATCFMNSVLQCLAASSELVNYFVSGTYKTELNTENVFGSNGRLAEEFANVLHAIWGSGPYAPFRPTAFHAALAHRFDLFREGGQQDAREFASYLLDCLHEDLNRVRGKKPIVEFPDLTPENIREKGAERHAAESWYLYLKRDKSIIVDFFQGQLRSELMCQSCGYVSTKFDPFMYLSVPVVSKSGAPLRTLGDCIHAFTEETLLCGDDQWYCPACQKNVDAKQNLTLWKLPAILMVHLKRFGFSAAGLRAGAMRIPAQQYQQSFQPPRPAYIAQPMHSRYALNNPVHYGSPNTHRTYVAGNGAFAPKPGATKISHHIACDLENLDFNALGAIPNDSPQKFRYLICLALSIIWEAMVLGTIVRQFLTTSAVVGTSLTTRSSGKSPEMRSLPKMHT